MKSGWRVRFYHRENFFGYLQADLSRDNRGTLYKTLDEATQAIGIYMTREEIARLGQKSAMQLQFKLEFEGTPTAWQIIQDMDLFL